MHSILRLFRRSFFVGFCVCVFIVVAFLRLSLNAFAFCFFRLSSLSQAFCALDCNGRSVATIIVRITYAQFCWTRIQLYWPVIWSNIPFCWCTSYDTINSLHHFFSLSLSIPISIDFVRQMQEIRWFLRWNWVIYFAYRQKRAIFGIVRWLPTQWYDDLVSPHHHHHQLQPTPSKYSKSISIAPKKVQFHLKIPILFLSLVKLFFFTWFCSGDFLSITFNRFNAHILRI